MNSANTRGSRPRPRGPDPKRRDPGDGPGREENAMNRETRTPNEPHGGKSLPAGLKPIIIFGVVLAVLAILGLATESKIIIGFVFVFGIIFIVLTVHRLTRPKNEGDK